MSHQKVRVRANITHDRPSRDRASCRLRPFRFGSGGARISMNGLRTFGWAPSVGVAILVATACASGGGTDRPSQAAPSNQPALSPTAIPAAGPPDKVRAAYVSVGGTMAPLWETKEAGLFDKYNLDVELQFISSNQQITAALISGDIDVAHQSGTGVIDARLGGLDIVMLAGPVRRFPQKLLVRPEITRPEDLRGKNIAVTDLSSANAHTARIVLRHLGLEPDRDVILVPIPGSGPVHLAAMQGGAADGSILTQPTAIIAKREGMRELLDVSTIPDMEFQAAGVTVLESYLRSHEDVMRRFIKAYVEGIRHFKTNKEFAIQTIDKYSRGADPGILQETWEFHAGLFEPAPYPTLKGIQLILDNALNPAAREAKPESFIDVRFVKELEDSGFIRQLYSR